MGILKRAAVWALILIFACIPALAEPAGSKPVSIVATNFVCFDFARQLAGEGADITLLIAPGTEVHAYEPSPADVLAIADADIFVCIGGNNDIWVDNILETFDEEDVPLTVRLIDCIDEAEAEQHAHPENAEVHEEHQQHEESHEDEHTHVQYDDHIWTSPRIAVKMVRLLRQALCAADEQNSAAYTKRAEDYVLQLEALDKAFAETVSQAETDTLIFADRFPFAYFVRDYGLQYMAAYASCARDMEPSPQTVLEMIFAVTDTGVNAVYTIEMSSQSIAKTIADETGVQILTLHSCQNVTAEEFSSGETYLSLMWRNVQALKEGLN